MRLLATILSLLIPALAHATSQSGSLNAAAGVVSGTMTAAHFVGGGASLTGVIASSWTSHVNASIVGDGTPGAPLGVNSSSVAVLSGGLILNSQIDSSSVTKQGNVFNGILGLVQTTGLGYYPALNGSLITGITASFNGGIVANPTVFLSCITVIGPAGFSGTVTGVNGATETVTAALTGVGTAANPIGVASSSVAVLSGGYVLPSQENIALTHDVLTGGNGSLVSTVAFVGGYSSTTIAAAISSVTNATSVGAINNGPSLVTRTSGGNFGGYIIYGTGQVQAGTLGSPGAFMDGGGAIQAGGSPAYPFKTDTSGNITTINGITTSFPGTQGAPNSSLTNNGSGTFSWVVSTAALPSQFSAKASSGTNADITALTGVIGGVIASTGVFTSTLTVQGNEFSVAGTSFSVSGGRTSIMGPNYQNRTSLTVSRSSAAAPGNLTQVWQSSTGVVDAIFHEAPGPGSHQFDFYSGGGVYSSIGAPASFFGSSVTIGNGGSFLSGAALDVQGNVQVESTMTVAGNAFSVGGSTLVVKGGNVGIGTSSPSQALYVVGITVDQGHESPYEIGVTSTASSGTGKFFIGANSDPVTATRQSLVFSNNAGSELVRITDGGNVGIGTTSPCSTCTLEVNGAASFDTTTNLMTKGYTLITSGSGSGTSFTGCSSAISTITIVTHGSPVFVSVGVDGGNSTLNDGCKLWMLQDGAYFNGQTASQPYSAFSGTLAANVSVMLSNSGFVQNNPSAGSHSYCIGVGVIVGGTCTLTQQIDGNFSVFEVR